MDPPQIDDNLLKDGDLDDLLLFDFEKNLIAGQSGGRKSNSLNDLVVVKNAKRGNYRNVESKVKHYIAALPAPAGASSRKTLKKHTSMPTGYVGDGIARRETSASKLEQEFSEYKRQSDYTISELRKQIHVSVALITHKNNENNDLMDRIERMQKDMLEIRPTPESQCLQPKKLECTPKKRRGRMVNTKARLMVTEEAAAAGSFICDDESKAKDPPVVATIMPIDVASIVDCTPDMTTEAKRNLSFNSSGDLTRRSGGTDSGINTSEEEAAAATTNTATDLEKSSADMVIVIPKQKRIKRIIARIVCCGAPSTGTPKITYKKI